jgi:hypothetical protein
LSCHSRRLRLQNEFERERMFLPDDDNICYHLSLKNKLSANFSSQPMNGLIRLR